jgi:hypothetical protein
MSTPIISYNSVKLTELEQEIADIPVTPAYDLQTKKITLDSSTDNHGTVDKYARGDHTHFLDLNDIDMNLKLPVKIVDEEGKIKKILIHETKVYTALPGTAIYFKYPIVPKISGTTAPSIEFNFKVINKQNDNIFSIFKIVIYITTGGTTCNIDNTYNAAKLVISENSLKYYTDDDIKDHFYFKVLFTGNSFATNITYLDLSTDSYIPEDFSTNDMIVTELPKPESSVTFTNRITNPFINAIKQIGTYNITVITNSSSSPAVTHPHIYGGMSTGTWSVNSSLLSGYYIWTFSGA